MKKIVSLVCITIIAGACGGDARTVTGDAEGGAGVEFDVRETRLSGGPNPNRFQPAAACYTNFGACPMMVAIPIGAVCNCGGIPGVAR